MAFATRFALYLSVITMIGSVVFALIVAGRSSLTIERRADLQRQALLAGRAAALAMLVLILPARLYLQLDAMRFPGEPIFQSLGPLRSTEWGVAWTVQWFAISLFLGLARGRRSQAPVHDRLDDDAKVATTDPSVQVSDASVPSPDVAVRASRVRGQADVSRLVVSAALLAIVAAALAFSGHAASVVPNRGIAIAADSLHVLGVGAWMGTLGFMLLAVMLRRPAANGDESVLERATLVNAFSPVALSSAAVIATSGFVSSLMHIHSFAQLAGSAYGRVLLLKLALVATVLLFGFLNWKRNTALIGSDRGVAIRAGAMKEFGAMVLVLLITTAFVVTPPPAMQ